jgi:CRP-like cAMP-binding protein
MSNQPIVETLGGISFLHDISHEFLEQIASVAKVRDYDEGATVFREGDPATAVDLVVSGNVSLEICAPGVGCKRVLTVGSGEVLAWSGLLENSRLTATARALEATRVVEINSAQLLSMCERNPALGYEIMRRAMLAVSGRLSATRMQLVDVYGVRMPTAPDAEGRPYVG